MPKAISRQFMSKREILNLFPVIIGDVKGFYKIRLASDLYSISAYEGYHNFVHKQVYDGYKVNTFTPTSYITTNNNAVFAFTSEEVAIMFKMRFL